MKAAKRFLAPIYVQKNNLHYRINVYPLNKPENLSFVLGKVVNLLTWPDGWNGYNALAPQFRAVKYAYRWIAMFYWEVLVSDQEWLNPAVGASGDGEVVFEWDRGMKRLTIYIDGQSVEYVQSWGPNINTEMADGSIRTARECLSLWKWLMSNG